MSTGLQPRGAGVGSWAIVGSTARTEVCVPVTRGLDGQGSFLADDAGDRTKPNRTVAKCSGQSLSGSVAGASGKSAAWMQGLPSQTALLILDCTQVSVSSLDTRTPIGHFCWRMDARLLLRGT